MNISPGIAIYAYIGTIGFIYLAVTIAEHRRRQRELREWQERHKPPRKRRIPPHRYPNDTQH